jgi:hypothetical protein
MSLRCLIDAQRTADDAVKLIGEIAWTGTADRLLARSLSRVEKGHVPPLCHDSARRGGTGRDETELSGREYPSSFCDLRGQVRVSRGFC